MNEIARFTFDSAYRQLAQIDRAFVDDFVARIEDVHDKTGRDLFEILGTVDFRALPERDQSHLAKSIVRAAIAERIKDLKEAQNVNPRRITKRIASLAFTSLNDFYVPGAYSIAEAFDLDSATPEQRAAIKEVEVIEEVRTGRVKVKFKLHDPTPHLRMLAQLAGLFDAEGNVTNHADWAASGGIPTTATLDDLTDAYQRMISDDA